MQCHCFIDPSFFLLCIPFPYVSNPAELVRTFGENWVRKTRSATHVAYWFSQPPRHATTLTVVETGFFAICLALSANLYHVFKYVLSFDCEGHPIAVRNLNKTAIFGISFRWCMRLRVTFGKVNWIALPIICSYIHGISCLFLFSKMKHNIDIGKQKDRVWQSSCVILVI